MLGRLGQSALGEVRGQGVMRVEHVVAFREQFEFWYRLRTGTDRTRRACAPPRTLTSVLARQPRATGSRPSRRAGPPSHMSGGPRVRRQLLLPVPLTDPRRNGGVVGQDDAQASWTRGRSASQRITQESKLPVGTSILRPMNVPGTRVPGVPSSFVAQVPSRGTFASGHRNG